MTPFALTHGDQFRPDGPPDITSAAYAAEFNEVKQLGATTSSERSADQTEIALFWADGPGSYTPPGHWNQIATEMAAAEGLSGTATPRLLTQLNVALADAAVGAWDAKYTYGSWRPVTAIRLANTDGNAATAADPSWVPLLTTPNHPDYVAGHATFSAAAATVLADVFGEQAFSATSVTLPGVTREFDNFADAAAEAAQSRIYAGIHFRSAVDDGMALGHAVGDWVLDSFRHPLAATQSGRRTQRSNGTMDHRHRECRPTWAERPSQSFRQSALSIDYSSERDLNELLREGEP